MIPFPSIDTLKQSSLKTWNSTSELETNNYKYYIEEKIDGSQLSILVDNNTNLTFYNKYKQVYDTNEAFRKAITMLNLKYNNKHILNPNFIYHGESVCKLRHNVITYNRVPKNYFILYDIYDLQKKCYISYELKKQEAERVGLECVQLLYYNTDKNCYPYDKCSEIIKQIEENIIESCLGGYIEGIVLKHHAFVHKNRTSCVKLKFVTDIFKERHTLKQDKVIYSSDEFLERLGKSFCTNARFHKAYQHLVENSTINPNNITNSDINKFILELDDDFNKEYKEEIMMLLWTEFSSIIKKNARDGAGAWFMKEFIENK